jgi:hypothetical protein
MCFEHPTQLGYLVLPVNLQCALIMIVCNDVLVSLHLQYSSALANILLNSEREIYGAPHDIAQNINARVVLLL